MSGTPAVAAAESGTPAGADLLPARQVDLGHAARVGLIGGVTVVFVAAIGMVEQFDSRALVGPLSLGYTVLFLVPLGFGYLAGGPPPQLEGFSAPAKGVRNLLAGLLTGALIGAVLGAFVALVGNFDVRDILTNVSPELVRILTFDRGLVGGAALMLVVFAVLSLAGGAAHLLDARWRRPLLDAILWVLLLGMLEALVTQVLRGARISGVGSQLYGPSGELRVPAAIVVAIAVYALSFAIRARRGSVRARLERMAQPDRRRAAAATLVVIVVALAVLPRILGVFLTEVLNIAGIFLLMALGLNIVVGLAGLLDLGYVAFFAVGAYTTAVLTAPASPAISPELTFWLALPLVILAAAFAGILVGTPVLRMRGDYLAIVTLGFGEIARILFLSDWFKPIFGGALGIIGIPDIAIGPLVIRGPQLFFYAVFAFVLIAAYMSYAVQDSRMGRAWMAMREDESVAEAMGVNIVAAKLWAFIIGAVLASFAGALFAVKIGSVFPHSFEVFVSFTVLIIIIVGGMASVPGVVLGALVLVGLPELLREFEQYRFLIYGVLLIFMMLKRPEGFIPSRRRARELHEEEGLQDAWLKAQKEREAAPAEAG